MVVDSDADDLIVSPAVTGTDASWLKPSLRAAGLDPDHLGGAIQRDYSGGQSKRWKDIWAAGQGLGRIDAVAPTAAVVERLEREYRAAADRFIGLTARAAA